MPWNGLRLGTADCWKTSKRRTREQTGNQIGREIDREREKKPEEVTLKALTPELQNWRHREQTDHSAPSNSRPGRYDPRALEDSLTGRNNG